MELASRIISEKTSDEKMKRYSGLDLNIGGEGLKAFYDRILPSVIGKLVKPLGWPRHISSDHYTGCTTEHRNSIP